MRKVGKFRAIEEEIASVIKKLVKSELSLSSFIDGISFFLKIKESKKESSYVKLQDAFAAERNAAGGWKLIGYSVPASNNFEYTGAGVGEAATVELTSLNDNIGFQAQNVVALNDCAANAGCEWNLKMSEGNGGNGVAYAAYESPNAAALTPSFCKIGGGATCGGSAK